MIQTGFETRIKIQDVIESQLPGFILQESPLTPTFLKQYYTSQEYQGGPTDLAENLDQYLKLDNLTPEVVVGNTYLSAGISSTNSVILVNSTKGYPQTYGLLKVDDEIITYTGITTNTFTGCVRGFSGITSYHSPANPEELVFSTSKRASHTANAPVSNLSSLFLKEFYKKIKYTFTPGLENNDFVSNLNIGNFIKSARSFYQSKGTKESFRILFNVLYGITPTVINLDDLLIKPSSAEYLRREEIVVERISGNPNKLVGQTITKSTDPNTYASVSQVEPFDVKGKIYYKLSLFVGYNDSSAIVGTFDIPGKTKSIETISIGSSVISVDSTIGFPQSGNIISGTNSITYTNKSVNQFYGCSGITTSINSADDVRLDETVFGYENGDTTKLVELRITGVLSNFVQLSPTHGVSEGDEISVNYLGEIIKNPSANKTYTQVFANSWIYNTSSRYQIKIINGSSFSVLDPIDKSSLKVGDKIDILLRDTQIIVSSTTNIPYIGNVDVANNQITINNNDGFTYDNNLDYDIRKRLNKATSNIVPIEFGNNKIISDVQNLYLDDNNNYSYVASNGLPSYAITKDFIQSILPDGSSSSGSIQGYDSITKLYSILSFPSPVPFINGDAVYYLPQSVPLPGLQQQVYYVEVLSSPNQIRLHNSRSFILSGTNYVEFNSLPPNSGSHQFILNGQNNDYISSQKILRKFPLVENIQNGSEEITVPGSIGMLINGVEIENYKTDEKIYYGPLDSIRVLNTGSNYDVINPPIVTVSAGLGSTALIQPVLSGSVQSVFVTPQNFDLNTVVSIAITGGNGSGAVFNPIIQKRRREILFDARQSNGIYGGIDINNETITFLSDHNLNTGDSIIYDSNGNSPLGIGSFGKSNLDQSLYLGQNSIYYVSVVNSKTILLYNSAANAFAGINTVGITTINNNGIHKFKSGVLQNTITGVKVINGGNGYANRKLIVKPSGISTSNNSVYFDNHGFNDGELVVYNYQTSPISGLNTISQYYISKIDNDYFKLCDAGIGGTNPTNYIRGNIVNFSGIGSGYQYFSYPPISLIVTSSTIGVGTTAIKKTVGVITATPVIRGQIIDAYLYENGSDYGSTILNLHVKPFIKISSGSKARLTANVFNGQISSINILYGGENYYSSPDITINGSGSGAIIQPVISGGKIINAIVINPGLGYSSTNISVNVSSPGSNAIFDSAVRSLTINNNVKYGDEIIKPSTYNLKYSISGYSVGIRSYFGDNNPTQHSPIIGWAYDGNPIYGSFGYLDPQNTSSQIKILKSGYQLNANLVFNRPSGFASGYFVEDYVFNDSGDLDQNNGRFAKTPDFPNGVYAYFAGVTTSQSSSTLISNFPYFIGNTYRSKFISENGSINQSFDFNKSNLIRNTFPYNLNNKYSTNDFIIESSTETIQKSIIESISKGSIDDFNIISGGTNYKVGDQLQFDNTGTNGEGLNASVYSISGVGINSIQTSIQTYSNSIFTWKDANNINVKITPYHNLLDGDNVVVSGLTTNLSNLNGFYSIGVTTYYTVTTKYIPSNPSGIVTDIYVSQIPSNISIGSSFIIGNEILPVLNIFVDQNVIRTNRVASASTYATSTTVKFIPDTFNISKKLNYFGSKLNDTVFFNPLESVGCGVSAGVSTSTTFIFAGSTYQRSIPSQSIYIENHPFKNNQQVILSIPDLTYSPLSVSTSFGSNAFNLPLSGISTVVYVTNKSKDTIGIKTTLNSSEVFFVSTGTNSNSYLYSIQSNYNQVISQVQKIQTTVLTSSTNNLSNNDLIQLTVNPNLSVGIGTSSSVYVKYDFNSQRLLINPIGFSSAGINTSNNVITLPSHNLVSGNKILYSASDLIASGLSTGQYFVSKIDNDRIQLCQTYYDSQQVPPNVVSISSSGGSLQTISPINPQIPVIKNNNLVFNLSDPSLVGYKLKLYFDKDFNNEFVSIGTTSGFNLTGVGTIGVSTNASATLGYDQSLPTYLYYSLEKSGLIINSDSDVINASQIIFLPSVYTGTYNVSGVGSTSFNISLQNIPETLSYTQAQCNNLIYSTQSLTAYGSINRVKLLSGGVNYKKLPTFIGVNSPSGGINAYIIPQSKTIGNIKTISILNEGFEYSSDKTLKPTAYISPQITLRSNNLISNVGVINQGKYYISPPDLIVIDNSTRTKINNGALKANLVSNSVNSVTIIDPPKGLSSNGNTIIAINNTNGLSVDKVYSSLSGVVTCVLTTPILGFSTYSPTIFSVGDKIFVEGITNNSSGSGYNSVGYGYTFFTITKASAITDNPFQLEYNVSGLTTYAGIANTAQGGLASIIKYQNYPQFSITQKPLLFSVGENLLLSNGGIITKIDSKITYSDSNSIKVFGSYKLSAGNVILGEHSGTIATIDDIEENYGKFDVSYSTSKNYGWSNDVGKLNQDSQVIPDNDYYQNLSYTVKSPIQFEEMITPVNSLLHTSGIKNFADVGITSSSKYNNTGITSSLIRYDIIDENRVDTIYNFDTVIDYNVVNNFSNFLKVKNKNLSDYIKCSTNRVLEIDDISSQFSDVGLTNSNSFQNNILELPSTEGYNRVLLQIIDSTNTQFQLTELIILNDSIGGNLFLLEKGSLYNQNQPLGSIQIYTDSITNNSYLQLKPTDSNNFDYNIKILQNYFSPSLAGVGSTSVGFVNLISSYNSINSGLTTSIVSVSAASTTAIYSNIEIVDTVTNFSNYVEIYLTSDGINTYLSEYYFDSEPSNSSSYLPIGSFGATISSGILSLNYTNTGINPVNVYSKNIGLGSTSAGIGTYRFILPGQLPGYERTAKYQSNYSTVSTASSIVTVNRSDTSAIKSLVEVSIGSTSALHQVMVIQDNTNIYTLQYPFLSIGSTSGIGTFGGRYDGSGTNFSLVFYPDSSITGNINVLAYSECLYRDIDSINIPPNLQYGTEIESIKVSNYYGSNSNYINKLDFILNYQGTPIFQKSFNPTDSAVLNPVTGVFTLPNHFFVTGEPLNYVPSSTFTGVGYSAVGIGSTLNSVGIVTNLLPSIVYPIKLTNDTFKLATRSDYAAAGIYVTFTSYGLGNYHLLQMNKRLERTIISIDNVIQYPISYTPINYSLKNNGGTVSASSSIFSLSGISSIKAGDLLYVDNEYMKVINVGLGTTNTGPISGTGTIPLVNINRGVVGSSATSHIDSTLARIYRGSYNISGNQIHFVDPPHGNLIYNTDFSNLPTVKSSFNGRVFLRSDYSGNQLYDDISNQFTGIGQTYTLTTQGINTVGLGTIGNGIVLINGIFQTPTTANNSLNSYSIIQNIVGSNPVGFGLTAGADLNAIYTVYGEGQIDSFPAFTSALLAPNSSIDLSTTNIVFSGISSTDGSLIQSVYDVNQNNLPRGGIIVSLASTPGLGYAPLVGASVTAILNGSGSIVGFGTTGNYGSGYYGGSISIGITDSVGTGATINASVGVGGTLIFTIINPGSGYVNPKLSIPSPSYTNLPVIGVSRLSVGNTTATGTGLLLDVGVSASSTTGIGSTLFEVSSFSVKRNGYSFQKGDVFTPVGLVTAKGLSSPISQFQLTVIDTFTDSFAAWQFGDLDYIDSVFYLQDGVRTRFPLYYNGALLSFQNDPSNLDSSLIDFNAILLIFVNGVMQVPGSGYQFSGGSSFTFTEAPLPQDKVSIFFYRGTRGIDSSQVSTYETIKSGDNVQVFSNNSNPEITKSQNQRTIIDIPSSDKIQTNIYNNVGIDSNNYKPISWTKQKTDTQINGQIFYKSRNSIESLIYPTAKVIKNFTKTDNQLFVDNATFFKYEQNLTGIPITSFDGLIVNGGSSNPISAAITATVSAAGTISALTITNPGSGYVGNSIVVKISNPWVTGVGIGTTATATITLSNGSLTAPITITNPGFGYSISNPPQVIAPLPSTSSEYISGISLVQGFSGIITGISTTTGTFGNPLAINFYLNTTGLVLFPSGLSVNYPIFIYNTSVGNGVTSIDTNNNSIVGIGTSHLDNIYTIHNLYVNPLDNTKATITCNINSNTSVVGIATTGNYLGSFSWGRLSGFSRSSSPISIAVTGSTVDVGLTTFTTIQRRNYGIRNTGGLKDKPYN